MNGYGYSISSKLVPSHNIPSPYLFAFMPGHHCKTSTGSVHETKTVPPTTNGIGGSLFTHLNSEDFEDFVPLQFTETCRKAPYVALFGPVFLEQQGSLSAANILSGKFPRSRSKLPSLPSMFRCFDVSSAAADRLRNGALQGLHGRQLSKHLHLQLATSFRRRALLSGQTVEMGESHGCRTGMNVRLPTSR
ncbi:hypothetical protein SODALDRAFT_381025 [Sodiomyces alkalinus F11]|uniref:Uncharacterized protein n=1 Tax=Sodiomyces alkalinus (strain CBS 110278 / VKM F-3762 / F11) TaxID=1314773 RepID=A0A3N2PMI0_SODAK|nr:hypothetical protein SODALDRAFT_381025 [Sodiomyces alkalinus F11]ROT35728.1 hypothetical protein SODALDRAFT_381025 [Sodiomyces alkalinus F11]